MATLQTVRQLTVRGRSEGLESLATAIDRVRIAQTGVVTVSEQSVRRQASVATAWANHQARVDPVARAYRDMERDLRRADLALDQGVTTVAEYGAEVERLKRNLEGVGRINFANIDQSGLNQLLGVVEDFGSSARESATAFADELDRMDEIARQKAQQIGRSFTDGLNERLVGGAGKSARDAASIFSAELDRLDDIAGLKAQQSGRSFTEGLNERLVGGVSKSAREAASVFSDELDRLDEIGRLKAQQIGANFTADLNERMGVGRAPISARDSASVFATQSAGGGARLTANQLQQGSYQLNDIVTMALMGAPVSQIAASQGGQIFQILQDSEGGVKGSLQAIKGSAVAAGTAITGMLGPVGLVGVGVAGLAVAAGAAFYSLEDRAESVNDLLEKHASLIGRIRDLWPSAAEAANKYQPGSRDVLRADMKKAQEEFEAAQMEQQRAALRNSESFKLSWFGPSQYDPIRKAVTDLRDDTENSRQGMLKYHDALARIEADSGAADSTREMAAELRKVSEEGAKAERELRKLLAVDSALGARQRGALIGGADEDARFAYDDANRLAVRQRGLDYQASLRDLAARSPSERAAAAGAREASRPFDASESNEARQDRIATAEKLALAQANEQLTRAQEDRARALTASLDAQRLEVTLIGKNAAETAQLRFEHEHLAQIEEEAARNRVGVNPAEIAAIRQKAVEIGRVAAQQEALNLLQSQGDQIATAQAELANMNLIGPARERAVDAAKAEIDIRKMGIDLYSQEANAIRANVSALSDLREAKLRADLVNDIRFDIEQMGRSSTEASIAQQLRGTGVGMDDPIAGTLREMERVDRLRSSTRMFFDDMRSGLTSGGDIGDAVKQNVLRSLNNAADKLWDQGMDALMRAFFPAPSSPALSGLPAAGFSALAGSNDNYRAGAVTRAPLGDAVGLASGLLGQHERRDAGSINAYLKAGGVNLDAAQNAWCAAFVNSSLGQIGVDGTGSNVASSFMNWGRGISAADVARGDVLVQANGRSAGQTGSHVGLATGLTRMKGDELQLQMLSGNIGNQVGTDWRNASDLIVRRSEAAGKALDTLSTSSLDATKGLGQFGNNLATAFPAAPAAPSGGLSGLLGGLFGGKASFASMSAISPLAASHIARGGVGAFASGTEGAPDGWAWVGEEGPELRKLRAGDVIRSNPRSLNMAAAARASVRPSPLNNNGGSTAVRVTLGWEQGSNGNIEPVIRGVVQQDAPDIARQEAAGAVRANNDEMPRSGFGEAQRRFNAMRG